MSNQDFGILAIEMYFPYRYVSQEDLELKDNCKGKYTIGLGQLNMAFTDDREDITSTFLTVVSNLFEKYSISPSDIGRLEVGTETLTDKSKSVKTSLMQLFGQNTDLEGVTSVNACYGGTAALFNSISWLESSDWDGRYALVVCGDIAVYEAGPARPTGGFGTLAILLGPNAPLTFETGVRSSHCLDVYDFYKPNHSEYAAVDGKLSQWAYLSSVDACYKRYKQKYYKKHGILPSESVTKISQDHFDYFAFHSPYNKLVQKGFARIIYTDFLESPTDPKYSSLVSFQDMPIDDTYESKEVETACRVLSNPLFEKKVQQSCDINQNIGNCYTGSVFSSLLSIVSKFGDELIGKRILMFSYGSGSVSSVYSFVGRHPIPSTSLGQVFTLQRIKETTQIFIRLSNRKRCSVDEFSSALELRALKYGKAPMIPDGSIDNILPGTYYLDFINEKHHRVYKQKV